MITLNDYVARLSAIFERPVGPLNETKRALAEQTRAFSQEALLEELLGDNPARRETVRRASFDAEVLSAASRLPEALQGRAGPGGSVVADPFRAGFFTIAAAIDGPRAETAEATWRVWHIPQQGSELAGWGDDWRPTITKCGLTGHHLFGGAFQTILGEPAIARRVKRVRFACDGGYAEIFYDSEKVSRFEHKVPRRGRNFVRKVAEIEGVALQMIGNLIGN